MTQLTVRGDTLRLRVEVLRFTQKCLRFCTALLIRTVVTTVGSDNGRNQQASCADHPPEDERAGEGNRHEPPVEAWAIGVHLPFAKMSVLRCDPFDDPRK